MTTSKTAQRIQPRRGFSGLRRSLQGRKVVVSIFIQLFQLIPCRDVVGCDAFAETAVGIG
jgi:hypothetical protein